MAAPFVFYDLRTPDADGSRRFYAELAGLTVKDMPVPLFVDGDAVWGGLTELPAGDPRPPQWVPYLPVTDLDETSARARSLGATVIRERTELPTGSVVVITDPGGATLALWQDR